MMNLARTTGGFALARVGGGGYLLAAAVLLVAEATGLQTGELPYPLIVVYVVLAFLSQGAVGAGLIRSGAVPTAVGAVTLAWNLGLLVVLPLVTPDDIDFPIRPPPDAGADRGLPVAR